ncbi:MAG: FAD-dependent thymidylate synthase [bacterium]
MEVTLVDHMGSDLSVVNAARVSFAKSHEEFKEKADSRLINYLAKHNHWSPFGHASMQFHIKAPIFVARQLVKHQVGLVWNEVSRRYVDDEPEFYNPNKWRLSAENKKQGSSEEEIEFDVSSVTQSCKKIYEEMLEKDIAPEMARMILPQSMMTEWYWSGTLYAFARVCNLRCKPDAQKETQIIADKIDQQSAKIFPFSWKALRVDRE